MVEGGSGVRVDLPRAEGNPLRHFAARLGLALGLVILVALLTYIGRDGYHDPEDDSVSLLDAFYYSTVSITTTGYGDIRPVTDTTRLVTTLVVTPARILFLIVLVGTTLEILAERSREAYRRMRWRKTLRNHVIVCGYGSKGRAAVRTLLSRGVEPSEIVVIDESPDARRQATAQGLAAIAGSGATTEALKEAGIADARSVVIAVDRDDTAVLATLTARECNQTATIVAAAREDENVHLLRQSGATSVITSSSAAGRLLGHAIDEPQMTEVLEDLLTVGQGLDLAHRLISIDEVGPLGELPVQGPVLAVIRNGELLRFDDPAAADVQAGDRIVHLRSHRG